MPLFAPAGSSYDQSKPIGVAFSAPSANVANTVGVQNQLKATPFRLPAGTLDRIGVSVTAITSGSQAEVGLYNDSAGFPGSLFIDAGVVSTTAIGFRLITVAQPVSAGWYWFAVASQGTATMASLASLTGSTPYAVSDNNSGGGDFVLNSVISPTATPGALPATFGAVTPGAGVSQTGWAPLVRYVA